MDKEQQRDLIERYLRGRMPAAEREHFESRIQQEPELADEMRLSSLANEAMRAYGEDQRVREWVAKGKKALQHPQLLEAKGRRVLRYRLLAAAAATVLMLVAASLFLFPLIGKKQSPSEPGALYNDYFSPAATSGLLSQEVDTTETLRLWAQSIRQYNEGLYADAAAGFEQILQDPSFTRRSRAQLLLATSWMQSGKTTEAIDLLQSLPAEAGDLQREARWYLALAHLQEGSISQTRQLLEEIAADPAQPHRKEAQQLLRELVF